MTNIWLNGSLWEEEVGGTRTSPPEGYDMGDRSMSKELPTGFYTLFYTEPVKAGDKLVMKLTDAPGWVAVRDEFYNTIVGTYVPQQGSTIDVDLSDYVGRYIHISVDGGYGGRFSVEGVIYATVRVIVEGPPEEDTCPRNWWLCCPPPPPEPIPVRPTEFVALSEYDLEFTYPLKSSRIPSKDLSRYGCVNCGPALPSPLPPAPEPEPEPEPDPEPLLDMCWSQSEGSVIYTLPPEFNKYDDVIVYYPDGYCTEIYYDHDRLRWQPSYSSEECSSGLSLNFFPTVVLVQGDTMMEIEIERPTGTSIVFNGNTGTYEFSLPLEYFSNSDTEWWPLDGGRFELTIEGKTYRGTYSEQAQMGEMYWEDTPPDLPHGYSLFDSFLVELDVRVPFVSDTVEMVPLCGVIRTIWAN